MSNGNGHGHHNDDDDIALPMSIGQFVTYIERRLSIEEAIEVLGREQTSLRVRVEGSERTIDLLDFFNAYTRNPALLDTLVNNFISVALGRTPKRATADFERLATTIYPMLKPIELLVTVRERDLPMLAYRRSNPPRYVPPSCRASASVSATRVGRLAATTAPAGSLPRAARAVR